LEIIGCVSIKQSKTTNDMKTLKALIVEDSEDDAQLLLRHLHRGGYQIEYHRVETAAEMEKSLFSHNWEIILSDYTMPQFDAMKALEILKQSAIDVPFIVISGTIGEDTAVQAMLAGVDDYFVKTDLKRLIPAIERELEEAQNRHARRRAETLLEESKKRLQLALNAAGMGVWEWNAKENKIYWSPECYQIFRVKNFSGSFENFIELIHPEDRSKFLEAANVVLDSCVNFQSEFRVLTENGETIWLSNHVLTESDEHGNPLRLIGTVQEITEKKYAENALRESEERLRLALEGANAGVWHINLKTRECYWSKEYREIYGFSDDVQAKTENWQTRIHPDDIPLNFEVTQKLLDTNQKFVEIEYRIINPLKGERWVQDRIRIHRDRNGQAINFSGIVLDITERKRSLDALRESEEVMRAIIQASTQFIFTAHNVFQSDKVFVWFSEICGHAINSIDEIFDSIHREDRSEIETAWRQSIEKKSIFNQVLRILTKYGNFRYLAARSVPMFKPDGSFRKWAGTFHEITERLMAEEQLKKSEERFRSLVNATSQIVWTSDAKGTMITNLSKDGSVFNSPESNLDENWFKRIHPKQKEKVIEDFRSAIKTKTEYYGEFQILQADNSYHYYVARAVPVYEKEGSIREWVGTLTDITKTRQSEENLRRSEEQLRQAQKLESVGRLAGGIAHDFNNMLTAINGYSDLALRRLGESDPLRRNLEEIKKAGERSAALTQQLLAFSRRTILQMETLDINQIVNDSIVMLQRLIGEDIQINSCLKPQIDEIKADSGQLSQMLLNLVVNARDAMPNGGVITISTDNIELDDEFVSQNPGAVKGDFVRLSVSDTGIGIDDETKQMIFEPFFTTKEIGKGTGLGLSTVYGIVNQLGGTIAVNSLVGNGTTFDIYLPSAVAGNSTNSNTEKKGNLEQPAEKIMLVEDEEIVRNLTRQVLEACGYEVIEASDGFEALNLSQSQKKPIDLLLTDVVMPGMGGRELAEKIKEIQPTIKILFTSGYTEDAFVRGSVNDTELNFIQKPFSFDDLAKKIKIILKKSKNN